MHVLGRALVRSARDLAAAGALVWLAALAVSCDAVAAGPQLGSDASDDWPHLQQFSEEVAPPADEAIADDSPAYRGTQRGPWQFIEGPVARSQFDESPPPGAPGAAVSQGPPERFFIRWLPEGIVPIWGPRTPDSRKDRGIGVPLHDGGWRAKPFSISGFAGASNGGPLIGGHVLERPSFYGGLNFGWDYDHYWGTEKRIGFGALNLVNAQHQPLPSGFSMTAEYRLMHYPLGDARWRPFITAGVGLSDFYFQDDTNQHHHDAFFVLPFGGGLKYQWNERLALRIDMIDELTFGCGAVSPFHYVALTAGLEIRFGAPLLRLPWRKSDCR